MNESLQEILRYLRLVYRQRYLFVAVSLLVMTLMVVWSYSRPKQYRAACTVFIETNVINSLVQGIAVTPDMDERIKVLRYALLSRSLLSRVLEKLGHPFAVSHNEQLEPYLDGLLKRISIEVRQNELFIVSLVDSNPHFAQDFINTLVTTYVEESLSGTRAETYGAKRFLDEQIEHFKAKLEASENAIIDFRKQQGVFVTVNEETIINDLRQYQREIETIDVSLATLTAQKAQYQGQLRKLPATIPLFNEQEQGDRIAALETRVRKLLTTFTESYPEVVRLRAEIESLKRDKATGEETPASSEMKIANPVYQEVQQNIFSLEAEISSLQSRRQQLGKILADRESALQDVPEKQKTLALLEQERDSNRRIYEQLLLRHSQSEVSKQMEVGDKTTTFRIVDAAFLPNVPISPNIMMLILLSMAAGLCTGAGTVIVLENSRDSLRTPDQLQAYGVPVLAAIPSISCPGQEQAIQRRDVYLYVGSAAYLSVFVGLLLFETFKRFF